MPNSRRVLPYAPRGQAPENAFSGLPAPVAFDGCAGLFHPGSRARGVILCDSIGPESDYVHRVWGEFAARLAAAGVSVLRFDYRGAGDSLAADTPDRPVRAWIDSVKAAHRWMTNEVGVQDVALVGLRFGAVMALAAAEELEDVKRIALLAPAPSGSAYCREMALLARVSHAEMRLPDHVGVDDGGLGLSPEAVADIRALDIGDRAPARRALVLPRPGAAGERKLIERLTSQGVEIEEQAFDDYPTLMVSPEFSAYPEASFGRAVAWLSEGAGPDRVALPRKSTPRLRTARALETAFYFRESAPLFGVLCEPHGAATDRPAALLLNTGAIDRAGMNGLWVGLARRLAASGVASLRFDISSFGDSPARPAQLDPFTNMVEALGDVDAAIEWLRARGHDRVALIGFCWGAQLACNIAQTDERVSSVVLVNPRRLFWDLETPPLEPVVGLKGYLRLAREPARLKAMLRGDIPVRKIATAALRLVREAAEGHAARAQGRETPQQAAARRVRGIAARGVDAFIVQGQDDPFLAEFEDYFETPRADLPALFGMDMHLPSEVDHLFRNDKVRADLGDVIAHRLAPAAKATRRPKMQKGRV